MPSFREFRETLELWERFPALERAEAGGGRVALTFDDGPDPDATPGGARSAGRGRARTPPSSCSASS